MAIKTFKHKKTGEIITYEDGVIKSGTFVLDLGCEPSKDFWEEIVEPEYTVLSFKSVHHECIFNLNEAGLYSTDSDKTGFNNVTPWMLFKIVDSGYYIIYSIKRNSDGAIFTVGDKYKHVDSGNKLHTIGSIWILANNDIYFSDTLGKKYNTLLQNVIPIKSLMTTSDGVDLYEGDTFFFIDIYWGINPISANVYRASSTWIHPIFSTQKAAENYVKMNKPCISLSDVLNLFPQNMDKSLREDIKQDLTKLIKTKI